MWAVSCGGGLTYGGSLGRTPASICLCFLAADARCQQPQTPATMTSSPWWAVSCNQEPKETLYSPSSLCKIFCCSRKKKITNTEHWYPQGHRCWGPSDHVAFRAYQLLHGLKRVHAYHGMKDYDKQH